MPRTNIYEVGRRQQITILWGIGTDGIRGLSVEHVLRPAYSKYIKSDIIKQLKSLYSDFNVKTK